MLRTHVRAHVRALLAAIATAACCCASLVSAAVHTPGTRHGNAAPAPAAIFASDAMEVDVIIVGAGWAGMAAADSLARAANVSFLVLEASNRTGGRVRPLAFGDPKVRPFFLLMPYTLGLLSLLAR